MKGGELAGIRSTPLVCFRAMPTLRSSADDHLIETRYGGVSARQLESNSRANLRETEDARMPNPTEGVLAVKGKSGLTIAVATVVFAATTADTRAIR